MGNRPLRFGLSDREPGGPRAREVKAWVRAAAGAPEDATVVVTELACSEPGCPPHEVVMAVLRSGAPPVQKKLHKRLAELSREEVTRLWQEVEASAITTSTTRVDSDGLRPAESVAGGSRNPPRVPVRSEE